jgi:hypothetical protein
MGEKINPYSVLVEIREEILKGVEWKTQDWWVWSGFIRLRMGSSGTL